MANHIYLFGEMRFESPKSPFPKIRKTLRYALIGYLIYRREPVSREEICAIFWPDISASQGKANLRNTLTRIRRDFPDLLEFDEDTIMFNEGFAEHVDVFAFKEGVYKSKLGSQHKTVEEKVDFLISLIELYRGEFLLGYDLSIGSRYEEWLRLERQIYYNDLIQLHIRLIDLVSYLEDYANGIIYAERLVELDPLNELAYQRLMLFHQQRGSLQEAQAVFERYESAYLNAFQETPPESDLTRLYVQIGRYLREENLEIDVHLGKKISENDRFVPPAPIGALFGRDHEAGRLRQLFTLEGCRLVTIQGIGGVGKTALAKTIANQLYSIFEYGACFIELTDIEMASQSISIGELEANVAQLILQGVGLKMPPLSSMSAEEFLLQFFRQKSILLILDNFEHVVPAKRLVARLLANLPSLKILITSREALNIRGEQIVRLTGLPVPNDGEALNTGSFASVELFLSLVKQKGLVDQVNQAFVEEVGQLVQQVDGLPLALEITADAVFHYSPVEISQNLSQLQDLASDYPYELPDRHLTLRHTFNFSWDLLSVPERELLIGLSVFRGKFSRQAVQAIFHVDLSLLSSIIQKSMLNNLGSGYYKFHALLKEFILDKRVNYWGAQLEDKSRQTLQRYYRFYLNRMVEYQDQLAGFHPVQHVREIWEEQLELEVAWKIAAESKDIDLMLASLEATKSYYKILGNNHAGGILFTNVFQTLDQISDGTVAENRCLTKLLLVRVEFLFRATKMDEGKVELDKLRQQNLELRDAFQRTLLSVVYLIERLGETEAALESLNSFLEDPRGHQFVNIRSRAYLYIAFAYFHDFKYSDALKWGRIAFDQYKENNLGIGAAETSMLLSSIYVNSLIEPEKVFSALQFAQEYYSFDWAPSISGDVEERIGLYYTIVQEDSEKAIEQYLIALNIFKKLNHLNCIYRVLSTLGYDHYFSGEYSEADDYFRQMDLVDKTNIQPIPLANGYFEWAQYLLAQYRFEEAENIYNRIFQLEISQNAREQFKWEFAWFYIRLGKFDEARDQMAVDPAQAVNNRWYSVVMTLSYINYYQGDLAEAQDFANLFWAQYSSPLPHIPPDRMNRYQLITLRMGDMFRLLGDYDKATLIYEDVLKKIPSDIDSNVGHVNLRQIGIKLGGADIARQQGEKQKAINLASEVTSFLAADPFAYHINLFQPYIILYRIFFETDAEIANNWLAKVLQLADQIASNIRDYERRETFFKHSPNLGLLRKLGESLKVF